MGLERVRDLRGHASAGEPVGIEGFLESEVEWDGTPDEADVYECTQKSSQSTRLGLKNSNSKPSAALGLSRKHAEISSLNKDVDICKNMCENQYS